MSPFLLSPFLSPFPGFGDYSRDYSLGDYSLVASVDKALGSYPFKPCPHRRLRSPKTATIVAELSTLAMATTVAVFDDYSRRSATMVASVDGALGCKEWDWD